jgi:DNA polymerase III delta prime subunit
MLKTMSKPLLKELFEKPNTEFSKHLSDPENARILFSGKFGIGKTTFINQFFEDNPEYVKIHLYPVNYSIASNEDIIDLIKYDILMELINTGIEFEEEEIPLKDKLYGFSQNNALEILRTIITCVPKTGKDIASSIKGFEDLYTSFQKYCDQISSDQGKDTLEFIEKIQNGKGSIYEQTVISRLISVKVEQLKNADSTSKRQVVLIIDDLDRIDPEHIFRLFNVFAAHFDSSNSDNSSNKFDFDKVVFICDVDNIRSIFKHRYGVETDFGGYIDKFYSREIFEFDNIYNYDDATNLLTRRVLSNYVSKRSTNKNNIETHIAIFIKICLELKIINLRKLCKYIETDLGIDDDKKINIISIGKPLIVAEYPILCATLIIKKMFGNDNELHNLLKNNMTRTDVSERVSNIKYMLEWNGAFLIYLSQKRTSLNTSPPFTIYLDDKPISSINPSDITNDDKINKLRLNSLSITYELLKLIKDLEANNYTIFVNSPVYTPSTN